MFPKYSWRLFFWENHFKYFVSHSEVFSEFLPILLDPGFLYDMSFMWLMWCPFLPLVLQFDLAQFLIENGLKIFREDITSLCGESPMSGDNSKKATHTMKDVIGEKQTPRLPGGGRDAQGQWFTPSSFRRLAHRSGRVCTVLGPKGKWH